MKKLIATLAISAFAIGFAAEASAARTITHNNTLVNGTSSNRATFTGPVTPVVLTPRPAGSRNLVRSRGFVRNYVPIRRRATFIPTP